MIAVARRTRCANNNINNIGSGGEDDGGCRQATYQVCCMRLVANIKSRAIQSYIYYLVGFGNSSRRIIIVSNVARAVST